jgi:hypothetical protein
VTGAARCCGDAFGPGLQMSRLHFMRGCTACGRFAAFALGVQVQPSSVRDEGGEGGEGAKAAPATAAEAERPIVDFELLVLIKLLRPDRLTPAIQNYVAKVRPRANGVCVAWADAPSGTRFPFCAVCYRSCPRSL